MENPKARWWDARRAQNLKPSTYRCPLCGELLPALSEHVLLFPEGDHRRRRHAHTACVMRARQSGSLPTKDEWARAQKSSKTKLARDPARDPAHAPAHGSARDPAHDPALGEETSGGDAPAAPAPWWSPRRWRLG